MNKRLKRNLEPFKRIQASKPQYHVSQATLHEQAIREDIKRFGRKLEPLLPLMDQRNKI